MLKDLLARARKQIGKRGQHHVEAAGVNPVKKYPGFGLVLGAGVLHYPGDAQATNLFQMHEVPQGNR